MPPAPPIESHPNDVVFLIDVDNTLLDNDRVTADLRAFLTKAFGVDRQRHYWSLFEDLRRSLGYADYLGTLQRYRAQNVHDPQFLHASLYLLDYPFEDRVYPRAVETLRYLRTFGPTVILSDGDVVFQPRKILRSGLYAAVDERALVYIHKEAELADVEARFPAKRYVVIDDKIRLLAAIKGVWRERVTTVFVRQGHYAHDLAEVAKYPAADVTVEAIGDLLAWKP
jgi:hypothetical protein